MSFEKSRKFDKLVRQVDSFAPISFEATKDSLKRFGEELQTKTPKRLKEEKGDEAKDDESTKKSGKRRKQMARKEQTASWDYKSFKAHSDPVYKDLQHLKLADQDGITSIPNSEIFEQLALMDNIQTQDKINFSKVDDFKKTKNIYSSAFTKLILRVKKLEARVKIGKARRQARVILSDDEDHEDDSSKQGRKLSDAEVQEKASTDTELFIQEVTPTKVIQDQEGSEKAVIWRTVPIQEGSSEKSHQNLKSKWMSEQELKIARDKSISRQYHSLKMKPKTIAQARRNMIKYLKNQGNFKISDFKGMSCNNIRPIVEKIWDFNQNIEPMDAELESGKQKSPKKSPKKSPEKSPEKIVEEEVDTQGEMKKLRVSVKGKVLADFIVERPEKEGQDDSAKEEEPLPARWTLFTDGSSCVDGCGAGVILTDPKGVEFTYALRFQFEATNNEAEYEALIAGLRITEK
ncbi:reverse transcriptase domain-containing protein [Tanacetum coccineum]